MLKYLYDHANQLCTRSTIAEHVFSMDDFSDLHPVHQESLKKDPINSAIRRLRREIEPNPGRPKYILTVRGVGYKLVLSDEFSSE